MGFDSYPHLLAIARRYGLKNRAALFGLGINIFYKDVSNCKDLPPVFELKLFALFGVDLGFELGPEG